MHNGHAVWPMSTAHGRELNSCRARDGVHIIAICVSHRLCAVIDIVLESVE